MYNFFRYSLISFLFLLAVTGCKKVAITDRNQVAIIPQSQMQEMASQAYDEAVQPSSLSTNEFKALEIKRVGHKIAEATRNYLSERGYKDQLKEIDWEFNLLASKEVNAWAMPGGKVAFNEGILPICQTETGIAVVMAHEIGHVIARHGNERMSQQLLTQMGGIALSVAFAQKPQEIQAMVAQAYGVGSQVGVLLPFSRTHEREADEIGLHLMTMAGYDPLESIALWRRMAALQRNPTPEFLSTHPSPENRARYLSKKASAIKNIYKNYNKIEK